MIVQDRSMKKIVKLLLVSVLCLSLVGCKKEEAKTILTLAAAASLEYVFVEKLIPLFEKENPSIKIEGTYDSSGKLQMQIENGLQADLFFSAATSQMDALVSEKFIQRKDVVDLLQNEVVLIVPQDSSLDIQNFADILKADKIAIGDPDSVPAGQYAKAAFEKLGIYDQVLAKSSLGTNVTEVLNWVGEKSAQAGIVYASDAATSDKVKVVSSGQKENLIDLAMYPLAILKNSKHRDEAKKFFDFLQSSKALEIFSEYGFTAAS